MSGEAHTDDERTILRFFDDWSKSDPDALIDYFTEDAFYAEIGAPPRVGRDVIHKHLTALFDGGMSMRIETLHMSSRDDVVFTERMDYIRMRDTGRSCDLPIAGVMEMRDGKIASWREYVDLRTGEEALGI